MKTNEIKNMKVAEMRKIAGKYGIKNASQYRREVLEKMLIDVVAEANTTTDLGKLNRKELINLMRQHKLPYCHKHRSVSKAIMIARLSEVVIA